MFIPVISVRADKKKKRLERRKGGGGGGRGGGGFGSSRGGGSKGSKGSSSGGGSGGRTSSVSIGGSTKSAGSGQGGGKPITIPSGQLFAGRSAGGGTRGQVYGAQYYGSGYPGVAGRGVQNRGFPFFFWPLAWGGVGSSYLHTSEYGRPDNTSRPGGPLLYTAITSKSQNTTFRLLADNLTVVDLITDIQKDCSSLLRAGTPSSPSPYDDSFSSWPQPEQTVQYYRASSVALTLDGYNNTAVFGADGTPDVPLPVNIDRTLLTCLNKTIGTAVPLINGSPPAWSTPNMGVLGFFWVFWCVWCFV